MKPLKVVNDRVDDNSLTYAALTEVSKEQRQQLQDQSIHWLQQKLGMTETLAKAVFFV